MQTNQRKAGAILSYISIGLNNLIGLIYTPFLLQKMGLSEYGLFALASSMIAYVSLLDFGFGNTTVRYISLFKSTSKDKEQASFIGMMLIIYSVIGIFTLLAGSFFSFHISDFFNKSMTENELNKIEILTIILTVNLSISFPLSTFESIVIAYEQFIFQKIINIIRVLLQPLIMIPLLFIGYKSLTLVIVITVLNFSYLLLNFFYCLKTIKIKISFFNWNIPLFKEISHYSFWVFLGLIVDRIYWNTGQIILGRFIGTSAVAIYAVAIQFKNYFSSFSTAISSVFLPKITLMKSEIDISNLFIKIGRLQFIILAYILSGFILFGQSFIFLWAGKDYLLSYNIALIILIPLSIPLIQTLGITILQAKNKLKFRSCLYLVIAICSGFLSIHLTKIYGGIGCAVGIALPLIIGNIIVMNIYYYKKIKLDIPRFWREIGKMAFPILLLFITAFFVIKEIPIKPNWYYLLIQIILFSVIFFIILIRWSMNDYEKIIILKPIFNILKRR